MKEPRYLGDGVYAQYSNGDLLLTTGSHHLHEADNRIVLDPSVLSALRSYLEVPVQPDCPEDEDPRAGLAGNVGEHEDHFNSDGSPRT